MNPALDSRARFEAQPCFVRDPELLDKSEFGSDYVHTYTNGMWEGWQLAWEAWQAAIASMAPDRAQVLNLIFKTLAERVASPLESGVDGLGDIVHRFEVSDGQERRGVILTVTQLKPTPEDPPIAALAAKETT